MGNSKKLDWIGLAFVLVSTIMYVGSVVSAAITFHSVIFIPNTPKGKIVKKSRKTQKNRYKILLYCLNPNPKAAIKRFD